MNDPFNGLIRVGAESGIIDIAYERIKLTSSNSEYNIKKKTQENLDTTLKRKSSKERLSIERKSLEKNNNTEEEPSKKKQNHLKFMLFIMVKLFSQQKQPALLQQSLQQTLRVKLI